MLTSAHIIACKIFDVQFISQTSVEDQFGHGKLNDFCHI